MPNGLEVITKEELVRIQEAVRAILYSLTLGHLAKAENPTPDLKFKIKGYAMGTSQIRIDIIRRQDESKGNS